MKTENEIRALFAGVYRRIGKDPADLVQIKPMDGGWGTALSYEITRRDGFKTRVFRRDIDDANDTNVLAALNAFKSP